MPPWWRKSSPDRWSIPVLADAPVLLPGSAVPVPADTYAQCDGPGHLEDGSERTLEEVGRSFAVTRERIRQIEAKAPRKLRHPSRSRQLKSFLEDAHK